MGNRLAAVQGAGAGQRDTLYQPNALNQYDAITHARHQESAGMAAAGAAVSLEVDGAGLALDGTGTGEPGSWRSEADVGADW